MIHVIAVCHQRFGELGVFVQSWINQSDDRWLLTVIHDGPNVEFDEVMSVLKRKRPKQIEFFSADTRYNDYGHSLREIGLKDLWEDFVLLTNADNYFIPRAVEFLNSAISAIGRENLDVLIFDMIHSHNRPGGRPLPPYAFFDTKYERCSIDISAAIVSSGLAKRVGFRDKSHDGDATYFEDLREVVKPGDLRVFKLPRVLFVHN